LKRFETLSFVDPLLPQPTGAMSSISKGQEKKKKKNLILFNHQEAA